MAGIWNTIIGAKKARIILKWYLFLLAIQLLFFRAWFELPFQGFNNLLLWINIILLVSFAIDYTRNEI